MVGDPGQTMSRSRISSWNLGGRILTPHANWWPLQSSPAGSGQLLIKRNNIHFLTPQESRQRNLTAAIAPCLSDDVGSPALR